MTRRLAPWLAGVLALASLPALAPNSFFLHVAILILMWTLLGAAWNVLGGFAGQVSFGHAALFGIGAYVTMILYLKAGALALVGHPGGRPGGGAGLAPHRPGLLPPARARTSRWPRWRWPRS